MKANVTVAAVWENKARSTGRIFYKIQTADGDKFTSFQREFVAPILIGPGQARNDSIVWNYDDPLPVTVYFEASKTGKILCRPVEPEGGAMPQGDNADEPVPAAPRPQAAVPQPQAPVASAAQRPGGYARRTGGGGFQGGNGRKPEDKRPSLVTMSEAYAKDIVVAIISHNDDLGSQDPDLVLEWATKNTAALSKTLLALTLDALRALGFDPEKEASK